MLVIDMSDAAWKDWFAWYPVEIDAYKNNEISNGKFRYKVWLKWVKRSYQTIIISDPGDDVETWTGWKYKL